LVAIGHVSPFLARLAVFLGLEVLLLAVSALAGVTVIVASRGPINRAGSLLHALFQPMILVISAALAGIGASIFSIPYGWERDAAAVVGIAIVIWIAQSAIKRIRRRAQSDVAT
jgi:hypothetical protein